VQTVAGTVAEQSSAVQQMQTSSLELSQIASALKESADQFVTEKVEAQRLPARSAALRKAA
jgi:hypothetical protein